MFILGNDYREFHGSAAFNLSANHGTYAYPSPVSPVHASNVLDVTEGTQGYSGSYATSACSSHAPFPYTLDPSSCGGIPSESGYNQLSESVPALQDVIRPPPDFAAASFYTQANSEVHSDIPILQHDSIGPLSLPSPASAKPQMLRLDSPSMSFLRSPSEMTESVFSPMETHHSHMYSLSPEAIIALPPPPSPSPTLPLLPSALSPISMMTPPEQLTLPPLPPDPQSDSEPQDIVQAKAASQSVRGTPKYLFQNRFFYSQLRVWQDSFTKAYTTFNSQSSEAASSQHFFLSKRQEESSLSLFLLSWA
ncbi:hypothetical protein GGU10DRAFT_361034 [Lentinula aff. detonsa]|uniref:Uncharacterized protein n=1 Tax=Lentinula aff. detonsa TaxID=2804958 RepID=A0AA38KEZ6_9AGAR|nr:hypothetical protein GGU10DRAFT_361034 [Lentinula aff. detonsa]